MDRPSFVEWLCLMMSAIACSQTSARTSHVASWRLSERHSAPETHQRDEEHVIHTENLRIRRRWGQIFELGVFLRMHGANFLVILRHYTATLLTAPATSVPVRGLSFDHCQ